jgi:UPF0271 protein
MHPSHIDINADMGESYGAALVGNDPALMPLVSSANIACGFHGGDPGTIHQTVLLAQKNGVDVGAHPSYPDLVGFGRRHMRLSAQEMYDTVLYQVGAMEAFARAAGVPLHHVKPHGALYNDAALDQEMAAAIVHAIYYFDKSLILYGPPGSALQRAASVLGLAFCAEVFADRTYQPDGTLTPRAKPNALIRDTVQCLAQVWQILNTQQVTATDGTIVPLEAGTICIHGDGLYALDFARALRESLTEKGVRIQAPQQVHG